MLVKPVWIFFIDRQVQNIVGHEAYGRYFAAYNLGLVLLFLADAGLSNMVNQRVANQRMVNIRQLMNLKLVLIGVYVLACLMVGWATGLEEYQVLLYVALIQALGSLFTFARSITTANQFFTVDAWFSVIDKTLMILICGGIIYQVWGHGMSLLLFLRIQLVATAVTLLVSLFFIYRKHLVTGGEREQLGKIVWWVAPFVSILLLMSVHYRLDGFLLERMHPQGALQAGIYASAYRLVDVSNVAGSLVASFLLPFIARRYSQKASVDGVVLVTRHALMVLSLSMVAFAVVFAPWIQQLLYHSSDPYDAQVTRFCIGAIPGYFLVSVYGTVLTADTRFRSFIGILVVTVVINASLNLLLIPSYGAMGCCMAALASQYFCGVATCLAAVKKSGVQAHLRSVVAYLLYTLALTLLFYLGKVAVRNVWTILVIAGCLVGVVLATQLRYFKKYFIALR